MPRSYTLFRLSGPRIGRPALAVIIGAFASACGGSKPVILGDGMPRDIRDRTVVDVATVAVDSGHADPPVRISHWMLPPGPGIVRAVDGAIAFADDDRVVGVMGHEGSRESLLAAVVYNARGVPQVVPNSTSRRLGTVGPWTFPLVPSDSVEGAFLASYAVDALHAQRIAVLYVGDEYGAGLRDGVRNRLISRGLDLADATMVPNAGCGEAFLADVHRATVLASLRRARPDVVILATGTTNGACLARIIGTERSDAWILGADGFESESPQIQALSDRVRSRIRSVKLWVPGVDSANLAFVSRFERMVKRTPEATDALAYDGFVLLARAAREGGGSRAGVRKYLQSLGHSRPAFPGVSGPISFDHGRVGAQLHMVAADGTEP